MEAPATEFTLKRLGKVLASGCLFALLGLGGLLVSLLLPLLRLLPGGPALRQRRARLIIHVLFRGFVFATQATGILRLQVQNLPSREAMKGRLILANHPSYLDVVIIISLIPDAVCVVKEGVWNNPCFGRIIREAGYVRNADPEACLRDAALALRRRDPLIIFPEGTRSSPGDPLSFRRGAAHLALLSGAEILPFQVACDPPLLQKGSRWYTVPARTCQYRVCVQVPIPSPLGSFAGLTPPVAARRLSKHLEAHFNRGRLGADPVPRG